jgi:hypothetical protein
VVGRLQLVSMIVGRGSDCPVFFKNYWNDKRTTLGPQCRNLIKERGGETSALPRLYRSVRCKTRAPAESGKPVVSELGAERAREECARAWLVLDTTPDAALDRRRKQSSPTTPTQNGLG